MAIRLSTAVIFIYLYLNVCEARRRPKIVVPTSNGQLHHPHKKADFEYNEYEYPPNGHPVNEESDETEQRDEPEHQQYEPVNTKSFPHKKQPGYSSGSGLRSIAQGSADQASSAVSNQHAAAKQAAYVAQNTLAQAASQAAATAQAALAGKQVLLQGLEQQSISARQGLESEIQQLQQAKRSAKAAQYAAQQALNHVQILTSALNNAQTTAEHAQQSATEAAAELASQQSMVGSAKQRVEQVEEQLHAARIDFKATQHAAASAASSAQQAQNNAAAAAVHASINFKEIPEEIRQHHFKEVPEEIRQHHFKEIPEESRQHHDAPQKHDGRSVTNLPANHQYGPPQPNAHPPNQGNTHLTQEFNYAGYK